MNEIFKIDKLTCKIKKEMKMNCGFKRNSDYQMTLKDQKNKRKMNLNELRN